MVNLSEREWLVLEALWDGGSAALGELTKALYEKTGWSRNTVLTYLTRMEAKGLVTIHKEGYPRRYQAAMDKAAKPKPGTLSFSGYTKAPPEIWWPPSCGKNPSHPKKGRTCAGFWTKWRYKP